MGHRNRIRGGDLPLSSHSPSLLAEFGRRIPLWGSLSVALYLRMPSLARSLSSYQLQLRGDVAR